MWGAIGPHTKIHYMHLLKWNRLFVFTLHIILDIIVLTFHIISYESEKCRFSTLSNFSVIKANIKMAVWAKWARYSIPHNFLNICDTNSIFVSLPMLSGLWKPVLTLILQLNNFFFFEVTALQLICLSPIRPSTYLIIWMSFVHLIGEHYLKWNH